MCERKYDTLYFFVMLNPLNQIFKTETLYQIISVNSMNELQIFSPFSVCYKDCVYKFLCRNVWSSVIDLPVKEKCLKQYL